MTLLLKLASVTLSSAPCRASSSSSSGTGVGSLGFVVDAHRHVRKGLENLLEGRHTRGV